MITARQPFTLDPIQRSEGNYGTTHVDLRMDLLPPEATHLLIVTNPMDPTTSTKQAVTANVDDSFVAKEIPLAWGDRVPGTSSERQAFFDKVIQVAHDIGTNPNNLMSIMAVETNGNFDPSRVEDGAYGLIGFRGASAVDVLNRMGYSTSKGKPFNPKSREDQKEALAIIQGMDAITQLGAVEVYFLMKIPGGQQLGGDPSSLTDLYMMNWDYNGIGVSDDTILGEVQNKKASTFYVSAFDLNHDNILTAGEVRKYLISELLIGFEPGYGTLL